MFLLFSVLSLCFIQNSAAVMELDPAKRCNLHFKPMVRTRGLLAYLYHMPHLSADLKSLINQQHEGHWIDMGSGLSLAVKQFLSQDLGYLKKVLPTDDAKELFSLLSTLEPSLYPKISVVNFDEIENLPRSIKAYTGRFFEEFQLEDFSPADVITDFHGVLSYTDQLGPVLERYLKIIKPRGKLHLFGKFSETKIMHDEQEIDFVEWIKSLPGLTVEHELIQGHDYLSVQKNRVYIAVPTLSLEYFDILVPPVRRFVVVD